MTSAIHDLGYKRYVGTRRPTSTRWQVIARNQLATAWKSWWRWKLVAVLTLIPIIVAAVWIFAFSSELLRGFDKAGVAVTLANAALPSAFGWLCKIAFVASLLIGASIIAGDVQSGAFVFYFARSTRPIDYLVGKLVGYGTVIASVIAGGATIVAIMRVALSSRADLGALLDELRVVPEALGLGLFGTLAFTSISLGFSAIVGNRRYALGLWAAYYLIVGSLLTLVGAQTNVHWLEAIDITSSLSSLANHAFDMPTLLGGKFDVPIAAAIISLAGQSALAIAFVYYKLSTAQKAGVGGST
jgi:hypothetical protein